MASAADAGGPTARACPDGDGDHGTGASGGGLALLGGSPAAPHLRRYLTGLRAFGSASPLSAAADLAIVNSSRAAANLTVASLPRAAAASRVIRTGANLRVRGGGDERSDTGSEDEMLVRPPLHELGWGRSTEKRGYAFETVDPYEGWEAWRQDVPGEWRCTRAEGRSLPTEQTTAGSALHAAGPLTHSAWFPAGGSADGAARASTGAFSTGGARTSAGGLAGGVACPTTSGSSGGVACGSADASAGGVACSSEGCTAGGAVRVGTGGTVEGAARASVGGSPAGAACASAGGPAGGETRSRPGTGTRVEVAFWNVRQLLANCGWDDGAGDALSQAAKFKLEWLDTQLAATEPAVLFLLEVNGTRKNWGNLRRWARIRGYAAQFSPGKRGRNGIAVLVSCTQGKLTRSQRLSERAFGVHVRLAADGSSRRFAAVHGFNEETKAGQVDASGVPVADCFARQMADAMEWLDAGGGGLLGGDFNRVVCVSRRAGTHTLTADDRRLRKAARWSCACCARAEDASAGCCRVVGANDGSSGAFTRWATSKGRFLEPTACLDIVLATGREEGLWRAGRPLRAERAPECNDHSCFAVSDHAYVSVTRWFSKRSEVAERRPLPVPISKKGDKLAYQTFAERTVMCADFALELDAARQAAEEDGLSAVQPVVKAIVQTAREALAHAKATRSRVHEAAVGKPVRQNATPRQRFNGWMPRLAAALRLKAEGASPHGADSDKLFAGSKTLALARQRWSLADDDECWQAVLRRCRREVARAGKALRASQREADERLYEEARDLTKSKAGAVERMQRAWRAVRERRAAVALDAIWPGDAPARADGKQTDPCQRIPYTDPRFRPELGRIGAQFVQQMADTPACLPAFEAWCETFMERFETICGTDGGDFVLAKELTWELFQEVLRSVPRGKAVGAGGLSVELLVAAGTDAQRVFYQALMHDLQNKRIASEWRTVLYALLAKPGGNAEVIGERREIALMAQDMKLLLQMVKRAAYQRVVGRVLSVQAGWVSGYSPTDPGLIAATIIQMRRRLEQPLYLLYIDLATFFGRCDRDVIRVSEMLHGLPKEVVELSVLIYGAATDPDGAVTCHYDSAGGLGCGFKNWMGALMGCVLSPDKAKLLLNTVIVAISAVCRGVRLWGYGSDDVLDTWRRIAQTAFADDWLGTFASEAELRKAWDVWRVWEVVSGCKLGVKKKAKTVVTGVRYVDGVATSVRDPLLPMRGGGFVPFAHHDEDYKHLGNGRRADGSDEAAWARLKRKFDAALARLKRLRKPSQAEFMMVSDALLGGLAGYYLQTLYITFEQAEEIERRWRCIFRRKFGEQFSEAVSKPRVYLYQARGKERYQRRHIWGVGLTALVSCFGNALADVDDTSQRAAARSCIALAMERWGCRSDPRRWEFEHLTAALESSLRKSKCRQLGDAWMLATALLEREEAAAWARGEGARSMWRRDFGSECVRKWGRWEGALPTEDPLSERAKHFEPPASSLLSEPTTRDGLGLEPEPWLLHAGVVAIGHMCRWRLEAGGRQVSDWRDDYASARRVFPRLPRHGAAAKAWSRQLDRLRATGIDPVDPERPRAEPSSIEAVMLGQQPVSEAGAHVDSAAVERLLGSLADPEVRGRRSKATWRLSISRCFSGVVPRVATEWKHGGRDRARDAQGARMFLVDGKEEEAEGRGGEGRWLARRSDEYFPPEGDEPGLVVGADGFAVGWQAEAAHWQAAIVFDEDGLARDPDTEERIEGAALAELPPALQLEARARIELFNIDADAPVVEEWPPVKKPKLHINLAVQRRNHDELCKWQARIQATAAFTLDGTRTRIKPRKGGAYEYVIARAAARHDGGIFGGLLYEPEGADNYIAELAAQIDAANSEDRGGRIILVFDATSPVVAMRKFARVCNRWRQGSYVGSWLDTLLRLLNRQEVVVFLWQTSHVGSPVNEWVDRLADRKAWEEQVTPVPRLTPSFASLRATRPAKSTSKWASALAKKVIVARLSEAVGESQLHETYDLAPLTLADDVQQVCEAVLCSRSCLADERRHRGVAKAELLQGARCPFGCRRQDGSPAAFTWRHAQFFCGHTEIVAARRDWVAELEGASDELAIGDKEAPSFRLQHDQCVACLQLAREGLPRTRAGQLDGEPTPPSQEGRGDRWARLHKERLQQRMVGGVIRCSGDEEIDRSKTVRAQLVKAVTAGARVQQVAHRLTRVAEEAVAEHAKAMAKVRRFARKWRRHACEAGPARTAAMRDAEVTAAWAIERVGRLSALGALDDDEEDHLIRELEERKRQEAAFVRTCFPRSGERAFGEWRWLALLCRWRLRAVLRRRSVRGSQAGERGRTVGSDVVEHVGASVAIAAVCAPLGLYTQRVLVPRTGARLERSDGAPPVPGVLDRERNSAVKWLLGGARRGELARERERAADERRRVAAERQRAEARARARFESFVRQGGAGPARGLSGATIGDVGLHVSVEIGRRQRRRRPRSAPAPDARTRQRSAFQQGADHDRWGRWAVERVLEVRRVPSARADGGGRLPIEARVRWAGRDPATGLPWPDAWIRRRDADGRSVMNAALLAEVTALEVAKFRTFARRAREGAARADTAAGSTVPVRWRRRLRSGAGAGSSDDEEAELRPPRRRRTSHIVRDDDEISDEDSPVALQGQRLAFDAADVSSLDRRAAAADAPTGASEWLLKRQRDWRALLAEKRARREAQEGEARPEEGTWARALGH